MSIHRIAAIGGLGLLSTLAVLQVVGDDGHAPAKTASAAQAAPAEIQVSPILAHAMQRDLGLQPAQLQSYLRKQQRAGTTEERAARYFGQKYAGTWMEADGKGGYRTVVATTQASAPARFDDADVRHVDFSLGELNATVARLDQVRLAPGNARKLKAVQSWAVDMTSNAVSITVLKGHEDEAVNFAALSGADVGSIRVETTEGLATTSAVDIDGGVRYDMPASGGGYYVCSIGFSVTKGTTKGFVTAGHCPNGPYGSNPAGKPAEVYSNPAAHTRGNARESVGTFQAEAYPGTDMAWASVGSANTLYGDVYNYQTGGWISVKGSTEGTVGGAVCRYGFASGWSCGTITKINVSANYGAGLVSGLRQSNACTTQGDSGGSWITGAGQGQGVTSGGILSGTVSYDNGAINAKTNCNEAQANRTTWYQPLKPILTKYGLTLATM